MMSFDSYLAVFLCSHACPGRGKAPHDHGMDFGGARQRLAAVQPQTRIEANLVDQLLCLQDVHLHAILQNCYIFAITHPWPRNKYQVATVFSGCDLCVDNLRIWWHLLVKIGIARVDVNQVFACECVPFKKRWIENLGKTGVLYSDGRQLREGVATNVLTNRPAPVQPVHLAVISFECDDASTMSKRRADRQDCVKKATGTTGETFEGGRAYVEAQVVDRSIWENVPGLGHKFATPCKRQRPVDASSAEVQGAKRRRTAVDPLDDRMSETNLRASLAKLEEADHPAIDVRISAGGVGGVTRRDRIFMFGGRRGGDATPAPEGVEELLREVTASIHVPPPPVDTLLFPAGHPQIEAWYATFDREPAKNVYTFWASDYDLDFQDLKYESAASALRCARETTSFGVIPDRFVEPLLPREVASLVYNILSLPAETRNDVTKRWVWDLGQNSSRRNILIEQVPGIIPNCLLFFFPGGCKEYAASRIEDGGWQSRIVIPEELFAFQGWHLNEHNVSVLPRAPSTPAQPHSFTYREMADLVGNSFHSHAFNTAILLHFLLWKPAGR